MIANKYPYTKCRRNFRFVLDRHKKTPTIYMGDKDDMGDICWILMDSSDTPFWHCVRFNRSNRKMDFKLNERTNQSVITANNRCLLFSLCQISFHIPWIEIWLLFIFIMVSFMSISFYRTHPTYNQTIRDHTNCTIYIVESNIYSNSKPFRVEFLVNEYTQYTSSINANHLIFFLKANFCTDYGNHWPQFLNIQLFGFAFHFYRFIKNIFMREFQFCLNLFCLALNER